MKSISRRTCLRRLAVAAGPTLPFISTGRVRAGEAAPPTGGEIAAIAALARRFREKFGVPGLSVAFARRGELVYQAAFGMADEAAGEVLTTDHRFRIASISKPITAVAIFTLLEQGKLGLDDKVFGPDGQLAPAPGTKLHPGVADITIRHLLTHTCGGWRNDGDDPMFRHRDLDHPALIARTLRDQPLEHTPGERYAYSNFGYCLLGRVIEKLTGESYAGHLQDHIFPRCGIAGMTIAGNTLAERQPAEVIYHGRNGEDPYNMNVRRMDAHGGWLATPRDLVKFLVRTDGNPAPPDLLKQATLREMFTGSPANPGYSSGWSINSAPNHWHGGSLPGSSTIAVQTASGLCWAGLANSRTKDIDGALDQLMWNMVRAVPAWTA